jgi:hypothetical protein
MYILQYSSGSIYSTRIEVTTGSSIDIGTGSICVLEHRHMRLAVMHIKANNFTMDKVQERKRAMEEERWLNASTPDCDTTVLDSGPGNAVW